MRNLCLTVRTFFMAALFSCGFTPIVAVCDPLFMVSSPQVQQLKALYRQADEDFPTDSFPLSARDLNGFAASLQSRVHSAALSSDIEQYVRVLEYSPGDLRLDLDNSVSYGRYDSTGGHQMSFDDRLKYIDPLAQAKWYFGFDGGPSFHVEAGLYRDFNQNGNDSIPHPQEGKPLCFEDNTVRQGYLYVPFGFGDITFGRQQLQIGPSDLSSLSAAEHIPFYDALRARVFMGPLTMTEIVATLSNNETLQEKEAGVTPTGTNYGYGITTIFYLIHYFEWSFPHARAGIGAQYLVSRENNTFTLVDFFPAVSWHDLNVQLSNMCLIADATLTPLPNFDLYFQGGLDDVNLNSLGIDDSPIPTIWAYLVGVRYNQTIWGIPIMATLEWGSTHYLWGNYASNPGTRDGYLSSSIYRMQLDDGDQSIPLTSPYGPGVNWLIAQLSAAGPNGLAGAMRFTMERQNTLANLYTTLYQQDSSVENAPYSTLLIFELIASYEWAEMIKVNVDPRLVARDGNFWLELYLHLRFRCDYQTRITSSR